MSTKDNFENHDWVIEALSKAQESDHDRRTAARNAHTFVDAPDGQWEDFWRDANKDAPRYTFDLTNTLIDQTHGQMERTDFGIKVRPAGGNASKETAKTYDGLVRNIENISDADQVYDQSGKMMITGGVDGWEVVQEYIEGDSFDQDLMVKAISDYIDSVWFGPHKKRDASDAKYVFVLRGMDPDEFKKKYPERDKCSSLGSDRESNTYYHRNDVVMVGEIRYLLPVDVELVLLSNGEVYQNDQDFKDMADEHDRLGITVERTRKRSKLKMMSRLFDANGWINDKPRETVFENWLNVVPCYANFKYIENKVVYWGLVEKVMDPQRVFNYSLSREVAETALAPKDFFWATDKQAIGS
jgi:hypothetical protein